MKKVLLVAATSLALLAACGSPNTPEDPGDVQVTKYTVTFYVDGNVVGTKKVVENESIAFIDEPTKDGYKFTGWYTSALCEEDEKVTADTKVTGDMSLYAGFEELPPSEYTITFDPRGGEFSGETTVVVIDGNSVNEPSNPSKEGCNFKHWSLTENGEKYNFASEVHSSFTLYAVYEEIIIEGKYNISTSSEASKFHGAAAAADDNDETYWQAADSATKQTLTIDLGQVKTVTHISQEFKDIATWNFAIEGSHDGNIWVNVLSSNKSGKLFEADCSGLFRYVRLAVESGENVATSIAFKADSVELSEGTNLASHFKGVACCHAGGYEVEKMFDGDLSTMYIPNSDHEGNYVGMETTPGTLYYVKKVVFHMADPVNYFFKIDYRNAAGAWIVPEKGDYSTNENASNTYEIEINDLVGACLYHQTGINSNWHGIREMEVIGFKAITTGSTQETVEGKSVYTLNSLSYIDRISVNDKTNGNRKIEISTDGTNYEEISMENVEGDYILVNKDAKYIRYSDDRTGEYGNDITAYGTRFIKDLALGIKPTTSVVNGNPAFGSEFTTLNKECKNANDYFYCANNYEEVVDFALDLGKKQYVTEIALKVRDNQTAETIKVKLEVEKDGTYETLLDTFEAPVSGQVVRVTLDEATYIQNIKITIQIMGTWTNIDTLNVYGYGA